MNEIKINDIEKIFNLISKVNKINNCINPIVNLRTIKDQGDKQATNYYYTINDLDKIIKIIEKENKQSKGSHIVFNYTDIKKDKSKGIRNEDVKNINFIFIDLDFKEETQEQKDYLVKEFEVYLLNNQIEYCYKSKGRGGFHYLIAINLENNEENTDKIKQFVKNLNNKFKTKAFDEQTNTPSKTFRLGGTYNFKEDQPILNQVETINDTYLKSDIQTNTDFINKIKVEKPQVNFNAIQQTLSPRNNNFFISFLENKSKWELLREDFNNAHDRNSIFIKNLAIFLKHNIKYENLVKEFIEFLGDRKKNRLEQLKGYLRNNSFDTINLLEIKQWVNTYNLENFNYEIRSNNAIGFNYEIKDKTIRFFKTIEKEDKKTGEISYSRFALLEFTEFYKINATIYNSKKIKQNKTLYLVRTTKDTYLKDYEDLINELQVYIKQNINRTCDI